MTGHVQHLQVEDHVRCVVLASFPGRLRQIVQDSALCHGIKPDCKVLNVFLFRCESKGLGDLVEIKTAVYIFFAAAGNRKMKNLKLVCTLQLFLLSSFFSYHSIVQRSFFISRLRHYIA